MPVQAECRIRETVAAPSASWGPESSQPPCPGRGTHFPSPRPGPPACFQLGPGRSGSILKVAQERRRGERGGGAGEAGLTPCPTEEPLPGPHLGCHPEPGLQIQRRQPTGLSSPMLLRGERARVRPAEALGKCSFQQPAPDLGGSASPDRNHLLHRGLPRQRVWACPAHLAHLGGQPGPGPRSHNKYFLDKRSNAGIPRQEWAVGMDPGPPTTRPGCLWHTAVRQVSRPGGDQSLYWVVLQTQPAPKRQLEAKEHLG